MLKQTLIDKVTEQGVSLVTYKSSVSGKAKYNWLTLDFNDKYIRSRVCKVKPKEDEVLFFCYDTDSYRLLKFNSVVSCTPLSSVLKSDGQ